MVDLRAASKATDVAAELVDAPESELSDMLMSEPANVEPELSDMADSEEAEESVGEISGVGCDTGLA